MKPRLRPAIPSPIVLTSALIVANSLVACDRGSSRGDEAASPTATDGPQDASEAGDEAADDEDAGDEAAQFDPVRLTPDTPHPFGALDLLDMARVSSLALAPDGRHVAYVVRHTDLAANRGRSDIYLQSLTDKGAAPRRLTTHPAGDASPAWHPDGSSIYFLSRRSDHQQVWRVGLEPDEGPPVQVTQLPLDVTSFRVDPTGKRLALTVDVDPECDTLDCSADRHASKGSDMAKGQVYDRLFVRHWDTWKDGRRGHLLVVPIEGGEAIDLTAGLDADIPSRPFGGAEDYTFSPDGQTLVYAARVADREEPWSTNFDLFAVPVGGGEARNLTGQNPAWDAHPVFSPDGKTLAYLAMRRPGFEADRFVIVTRPWPEGEAKELTADWDRSVADMHFSPGGDALIVTAQDTGERPAFSVDLTTGIPSRLVAAGTVSDAQRLPQGEGGAGGGLVFTRSDLAHPAEIYLAAADGSDPTPVTQHNADRIAAARMGEYEQLSFRGAAGDEVHGWLVKPVDFDPEARYPIAFLIHGGPQGSFGNSFHYRWNPQTYAGAGYAALMIDFHGSTGYGQDFTDAIRGDWGGKPLEDLQRGLAAAVEAHPWLDESRACALGASYGGYMINWIAGQWPEGFRCLVNHDGIFDQRSMYYATEELWFPEWEHGGPYWTNPAGYEKHNPARFVDRWRTPMLVIHGSLDYRVPIEQGLATFTALQRQGIESRFLHFPDENHWVLAPHNSLQWHGEVLRWLDAHLGPDPAADPEPGPEAGPAAGPAGDPAAPSPAEAPAPTPK